ncbi:hypothetical protein SAMN04488074_103240 [Lentzea albidocapillata subsp. violacea]|uniref:Uncharacterized protein n=1 Tax=Lentzea albidocapillata subsp. violacea TaxID=128104 RepID=A0A1G8WMX7_9PSEU|nr:hypothetical protein [Lentzea albidocapillata]SDJ79511.1 hypothetical protein SAMN04488074_103240 [Lentzea albidocapillata subsp. violacea]
MGQYAYFALVGQWDTVKNPFTVVRTGGEHDEVFSTRLRWEQTDLLQRTDSMRGYDDVVPISEKEGKRFETIQAKRVEEEERSWKNRSYFAIVSRSDTVDNPYTVVRSGGEYDQFFGVRLTWLRTDLLYRIDSGREYYDAVPISAEDGKRFEAIQAKRVEEELRRQAES